MRAEARWVSTSLLGSALTRQREKVGDAEDAAFSASVPMDGVAEGLHRPIGIDFDGGAGNNAVANGVISDEAQGDLEFVPVVVFAVGIA